MTAQDFLSQLGADIVRTGTDIDPHYCKDWTAAAPVTPRAVILPRTTEDVSKAMALCNELGLSVVPQGGLTGLVGGAMPTQDAVVINLSRLASSPQIDAGARLATVDAGTTLQNLQDAAEPHGLSFPVDLGARGSCQLGGMIATNAGGVHVLRHGMTRAQVRGLEVVLADGTILSSMNPLLKNNTGYDLRQLFIGSEGTLGIITRAVLELVPLQPARSVALARVADVAAAFAVLDQITRQGLAPKAFEAMWPFYYAFACDVTGTAPLSGAEGLTLLIEIDGQEAESVEAQLIAALQPAMESGLILDATLAQSEAQAQVLWALRDANEALGTHFSGLIGFDVSLPRSEMQTFVDQCEAHLATGTLCFGHLGDGNLHLVVTDAPAGSAGDIKDTVLAITGALGGSISAEHGVGTDKRDHLHLTRSPVEIAVMHQIKAALDPKGILNPGKLLPPVLKENP